MYLKALEIQGFKSFPDKTVLQFGEDITAIVGPNGSGKSNISDAIRWVMGEQSTRALRGGKMEDVIFGGTARRKQTGYAEVTLVLDNATGIVQVPDSEIMLTRRYYRSGESEYYINRRSVRLKDVNELFMDTGLGREGYSIIGQGKIDEILSVKSSDRREIFEEAAGISRFRHRKEESERKLARTQENLVRVNDKISELALQVEPLRRQSEQAKKFLILRDELRGLEISVWLETLERLRAGSIKLEQDYQDAQRQKQEVQQAQEQAYAAAEDFSRQMQDKDTQADRMRFELQRGQAAAHELESAIAVLENNIRHNQDSEQRLRQELLQQQGRQGSLSAQIAKRQERLTQIQGQKGACQQQLVQKQAQEQELVRSAGTLVQELEQLRRQQSLETANAAQAKALLSALSAAAQEVLDRDETLRRELAELELRLAQAADEVSVAKAELDNAVQQKDATENIIQGYTLRLQSRQAKADQAKHRHDALQLEQGTLTARIKLLTEMEQHHEGYSKAVKLVMGDAQRGTLRNIHGPVANLLKVAEQHTVAIETALGGAMQHLVVEREEDGKAVIQSLKRRDAGRATILPLSSIRPGNLREAAAVTKEPGFVGVGDTLISFDGQYKNVFSNLLGRVVVMEDLDSAILVARKYGYQFRVVTLDGQVLNPGGSMTGGSASRSAGILSRANELERLNAQLTTLSQTLSQAEKDRAETQRECTAASYELQAAEVQLRQWEDAILKAEGHHSHCLSVAEGLAGQQSAQQAELSQLSARNGQIQKDTQAARARIEALEGAAEALQSKAEEKYQGQTTMQERTAQLHREIAALNAQLAALDAEWQASQASLQELEGLHNSLAGDQDQNQRQMDDFKTRTEDFAQEIAQKKTLLQQLQAENKDREQTIAALHQERLELEGHRLRLSRESQSKNQALLRLEGEVSRLEQKKVSAAMEEKQLLDRLWEQYELSHEGAKQQRVELESVPKASRRIAQLKREISDLGNVNLGAIDEFQRVNERYTYLTDQQQDITQAKGELEEIIAQITGEMKQIFLREFTTINQAFGQTFVDLFGGGKAALELEDPDDVLNCGIEIKVQPPGKALKIITLLSGGEKAFVAIALYFAILQVRPTPFVVMDEIEAALDESNVLRFSRYMRNMSQKTQFIVITHRRGTMEEADILYGVTMQEQGVSRMLHINLNDPEQDWTRG